MSHLGKERNYDWLGQFPSDDFNWLKIFQLQLVEDFAEGSFLSNNLTKTHVSLRCFSSCMHVNSLIFCICCSTWWACNITTGRKWSIIKAMIVVQSMGIAPDGDSNSAVWQSGGKFVDDWPCTFCLTTSTKEVYPIFQGLTKAMNQPHRTCMLSTSCLRQTMWLNLTNGSAYRVIYIVAYFLSQHYIWSTWSVVIGWNKFSY